MKSSSSLAACLAPRFQMPTMIVCGALSSFDQLASTDHGLQLMSPPLSGSPAKPWTLLSALVLSPRGGSFHPNGNIKKCVLQLTSHQDSSDQAFSLQVMKIVAGIRQGRIVPGRTQQQQKQEQEKPPFYNIWSDSDAPRPDHPMNMPAPKVALPGHAESYNPPAEYLFNDEERKEWESADPTERSQNFMPQKHDALRKVGAYPNFLKERFERCLDLYLAPRARRRKARLPEDPEDLVPKLPSPSELKPFPQVCSTTYPHPNGVRTRCLSIDPSGQWLVTGADDGEVRLWELRIGRCQAAWHIGKLPGGATTPIQSVAWSPNKGRSFFIVATYVLTSPLSRLLLLIWCVCRENKLTIVSPLELLGPKAAEATTAYLFDAFNAATGAAQTSVIKWSKAGEADRDRGILLTLAVPGTPKQIAWHRRGDYFATVAPDGEHRRVDLEGSLTEHVSY